MDKLAKISYKLDELLDAVRIVNKNEEDIVDAFNHGAEVMARVIDHYVYVLRMMKEDEE